MALAINRQWTGYPLKELIDVSSNLVTIAATTAVDAFIIPKNTIITNVGVIIKTACVRAAGAVNFIVGDDDDDNGFIVAADAKSAAGTTFGFAIAEAGVYLNPGGTGAPTPFGKYYSATKAIKLVLSAALVSTDTPLRIWLIVKGMRVALD